MLTIRRTHFLPFGEKVTTSRDAKKMRAVTTFTTISQEAVMEQSMEKFLKGIVNELHRLNWTMLAILASMPESRNLCSERVHDIEYLITHSEPKKD